MASVARVNSKSSTRSRSEHVAKKGKAYGKIITQNPETRIAEQVDAIAKVHFAKHKLTHEEMVTLALVGDKELEEAKKTQEIRYLRVKETHLPRALVIDGTRDCYYILSKKFGELKASGTFKKVTDAIEVSTGENVKARNVVRLVNKAGRKLPEKELEFHQKYGKILTYVQYPSLNHPDEMRTTIIEEAFDNDTYMFCNYESVKVKRQLPLNEVIQILHSIGNTLSDMHRDGVSHQDFKNKNILYRKNEDNSVNAKVIDFGHSINPSSKAPVDRSRRHTFGTVRYSSPELIEKNMQLPKLLEQRKAEDMFALGCVLLELISYKPLPWVSLTYKAFKDPHPKKFREEAREKLEKALKELSETGVKNSNDPLSHLQWIAACLLEINPAKRMKIDEFLQVLRHVGP